MDTTFCTKNRSLSLEIQKKKVEARGFFKRFSSSKSQAAQIWSLAPPRLDPTGPSPGGKKRAFLCGITYKKHKYELKGVTQDLKNMIDLLVNSFRFPLNSILILAEDNSYMHPTKKNIEESFQWLMTDIQHGDSLVFYYSGHGQRQRDFVHDEIDGFDETICPVDFQTNGNITDNYINEVIVRPLLRDVTLHAIIDCCHSGTILDLPHTYNMINETWDDNHAPSGACKNTNGGKAICISACEDYQLAADTSAFSLEKEMNGAMTCSFIKAIKDAASNNKKMTYRDIMYKMHETLKQAHKSGCVIPGIHRFFHHRILQDPVLSSSEKFSLTTEFML